MLWSAARIGLLAYLGLSAVIFFGQSSLVFQPGPNRESSATPADIGLAFEARMLTTADAERLDSWYLPARGTSDSRGLVIFFHGNAGSMTDRLDYLRMFGALGLSTLIIDYRGYGRSSGKASEAGTYLDADAAWRHATQTLGIPPRRIVLFGESLGGAVATKLAADVRPGALILASTFTSIPDVGAEKYPLLPIRLLARISYDTASRLPDVTCPVLVIHSPEDEVVPFAHGRRLFDLARSPKRFLAIDGGHNDGFVFGREEWRQQLDGFIRQTVP